MVSSHQKDIVKNIAIYKAFGNTVNDMIDEIIMGKVNEGNESITHIAGT